MKINAMTQQGFLVTICLVAFIQSALASTGDESAQYRTCVRFCKGSETASDKVPEVTPCTWQTYLWDCEADCRYRCMWSIEQRKRKTPGRAGKIEKYHGKWPFVRLGPIQEPASVLLSILNLLANGFCLKRLVGTGKGRTAHRFKYVLWIIHFLLAMNAWVWSSVFHTRDVTVTERLDYFSAGALLVFDMYLSCCRVLSLSSLYSRSMFLIILVAGYVRHVYFMHYVTFDYGYHVGLCVLAGAVQSIAWIFWLTCTKEGRNHPGRKLLGIFVAAVNAAVLFEVLDFPPFFDVVDAHALWHLTTIPLTFVFYAFVARDVETGVFVDNKVR